MSEILCVSFGTIKLTLRMSKINKVFAAYGTSRNACNLSKDHRGDFKNDEVTQLCVKYTASVNG